MKLHPKSMWPRRQRWGQAQEDPMAHSRAPSLLTEQASETEPARSRSRFLDPGIRVGGLSLVRDGLCFSPA